MSRARRLAALVLLFGLLMSTLPAALATATAVTPAPLASPSESGLPMQAPVTLTPMPSVAAPAPAVTTPGQAIPTPTPNVPAPAPAVTTAANTAGTTLRVYGAGNEGAGNLGPGGAGAPVEDPPYTDLDSIFDPTGPQAPRKDSVTWDPAWMYENETFDGNQALYQQMYADSLNISEKVWFRHWYEPQHQDVDTSYPAIMEEFTYMLMQGNKLESGPMPLAGPAGQTQFVFPVGEAAPGKAAPPGAGLAGYDASFNSPTIVEVDSEQTLAGKTGVAADFTGSGILEPLDPDAKPLSGDELAVFSVAPQVLAVGQWLQFLDHGLQVVDVSDKGVTVDVWYTGDVTPQRLGTQYIAAGELWTFGTRLPAMKAPAPAGTALAPFFAYVAKVDPAAGTAEIGAGRALGDARASVSAGGPAAGLKRFYVGGHEYNVAALGTAGAGADEFRFITLRTPVPKVPAAIQRDSVTLQDYAPGASLPVLPPFNMPHYIVQDVQAGQPAAATIGQLAGVVPPVTFSYVQEDTYQGFTGQLQEVYTETETAQETWRAAPWQTMPQQFTEFLLPGIYTMTSTLPIPNPYLLTSAFRAPASANPPPRVQFWFDPAISGPLYATPGWLRIYGADSQGPGDPAARDPQDPACPVEVMPYTDPKAPFDPVAAQAPPNDSITFNPALLSEFVTDTDPLTRTLYPLISIQGHDAQEKVFFRTWYEPGYLDKVLTVTPTVTYTFPALQQEFTYMFLDTSMQPAAAPPGTSAFAFPIGMGQPMGGPGTGLTSFNADFDSKNDEVVHIHSEKTLAALTGIDADFTGDGKLDDLASAGAVSGDGLVVLTAEGLTLSVTNTEAMLLDHMVELKGVTPDGAAQLQIWDTGGDITEAPQRVGWPMAYKPGAMGITGRNKDTVDLIPPRGSNLGKVDGGWFVYVKDVNTQNQTASIILGRALGATDSCIDDGKGQHDIQAGDPWYLKRFFVDGHEYNVVAIKTEPLKGGGFGFKYITIRTPISVMPPFDLYHTIAIDVLSSQPPSTTTPAGFLARPPMQMHWVSEAAEPAFAGQLQEVMTGTAWMSDPFLTLPDQYTALALPPGELYLLTSSWLDENRARMQAWYRPGPTFDVYINPLVPGGVTPAALATPPPAITTTPGSLPAPLPGGVLAPTPTATPGAAPGSPPVPAPGPVVTPTAATTPGAAPGSPTAPRPGPVGTPTAATTPGALGSPTAPRPGPVGMPTAATAPGALGSPPAPAATATPVIQTWADGCRVWAYGQGAWTPDRVLSPYRYYTGRAWCMPR